MESILTFKFGHVGEALRAWQKCQKTQKNAKIMFFGIFGMHVAVHLHAQT